MEKAIRSNPNTSQIHYERSILGDIYHCDHECGQPQRLLPAFSDPNIFRSASASPHKDVVVPVDIHEFEIPFSTLSSGKSNDSGLPSTPPLQSDISSYRSSISSPSELKGGEMSRSGSNRNSMNGLVAKRSLSETMPSLDDNNYHGRRQRSETDPLALNRFSRINFTDNTTGSTPLGKARVEDPVQYTSIQLRSRSIDSPSRDKRLSLKLQRVDENDGIYDTPNCEPPDSEISNSNSSPFLPPSIRNDYGPTGSRRSIAQSTTSIYTPGSDLKERDEDFEELPPVPDRDYSKRTPSHSPVKNMVKKETGRGRSRMHSVGDVLECSNHLSGISSKVRGSVDNLARTGKSINCDISFDSRGDLLSKLHEQDELLSKILARSRNERNEELIGNGEEGLGRTFKYTGEDDTDIDHLYASPTSSTYIRSGRSSSSSDRGVERVLTKVASDTARGYAYKIQIPLSNREYDVPRRAAPAPDLSNLRSDGPPKPLRYITSAES